MKTISKKLTKKIVDMLVDLAKNGTKYETFWGNYAKNVKMGIIEDDKNRDRLLKLLRFSTSKNMTGLVSFEEYIGRMKEN
jgi:HSP90 family molecular chaperone